jgi:hypothetical protein
LFLYAIQHGAKVCPFDPALCNFDPALCGIARDHGPVLCGIARDQHIFVNSSANSKQNLKIF